MLGPMEYATGDAGRAPVPAPSMGVTLAESLKGMSRIAWLWAFRAANRHVVVVSPVNSDDGWWHAYREDETEIANAYQPPTDHGFESVKEALERLYGEVDLNLLKET